MDGTSCEDSCVVARYLCGGKQLYHQSVDLSQLVEEFRIPDRVFSSDELLSVAVSGTDGKNEGQGARSERVRVKMTLHDAFLRTIPSVYLPTALPTPLDLENGAHELDYLCENEIRYALRDGADVAIISSLIGGLVTLEVEFDSDTSASARAEYANTSGSFELKSSSSERLVLTSKHAMVFAVADDPNGNFKIVEALRSDEGLGGASRRRQTSAEEVAVETSNGEVVLVPSDLIGPAGWSVVHAR
ncbi:MAG: hypothetical protein RIT81_46820 [Deltaproteobacteria bacterium]